MCHTIQPEAEGPEGSQQLPEFDLGWPPVEHEGVASMLQEKSETTALKELLPEETPYLLGFRWSQLSDLNRRPTVYKTFRLY